jgi:Tol biopolymer transport system component
MNTRFAKFLSLAAVVTAPVQADVVGEVIAAYLTNSANTALFSAANGGQYTEVPCRGDLSHGGSPRYFLGQVLSGILLGDGYEGSELIASNEACTHSTVITDARDTRFSSVPHWSPDGTRIAVFGERFDLTTGALLERGVFLMDVIRDGTGFPVATGNRRLVIPQAGETVLDWSGDGEWLVYHDGVPDGAGGSQSDLFLFDLLTESTINLTNSPEIGELAPSFSPVDNRIAYTRLVAIRGSYRFDIFTIDVMTGAVVQVTSKKTTGSFANRDPQFSQDGQYLVFASGSLTAPFTDHEIYRIRSDGSGKAVNLTGKRDGNFRRPIWRE